MQYNYPVKFTKIIDDILPEEVIFRYGYNKVTQTVTESSAFFYKFINT